MIDPLSTRRSAFPRPGFRRALLVLAAVALLGGGITGRSIPASAAEQDGYAPESPTSFFVDEKPFPLSIARDRIGALMRDGVAPERLEPMAPSFGLKYLGTVGETIAVLGLDEPAEPLELAQRARALKSEMADLVAQSGLLVTPGEAKQPMLLSDEFIAQFRPGVSADEIAAFNDAHGVKVLMENPVIENQLFLTVTGTGRGF